MKMNELWNSVGKTVIVKGTEKVVENIRAQFGQNFEIRFTDGTLMSDVDPEIALTIHLK